MPPTRPDPSAADPPLRAASHYRGRFAPSPTGPLHFGSLIAAVASYADALRHGGEWLVRIEDVDEARSDPGAADDILATLALYGFRPQGEVVMQSARVEHYRRALVDLREQRAVYACSCSRARLADAPLGRLGERVYPGYCRMQPGREHGPFAWRVRVDHSPVHFADRLQGAQCQVLDDDVGDFVVRRADGFFAYQLAVVVDDAEQGITDVVRGADLLASTPRQIFLQRLLGFSTPRYLHVPVAVNADGDKLSKQTRAPPLPRSDPVRELLRAWRFLDQQEPPARPASVEGFWAFAAGAWAPGRLPPVSMLPVRR